MADSRSLIEASQTLQNQFPLSFRTTEDKDELLTILDFILFHLECFERRHPETVGKTLFNEKYTITSLPFWLKAVEESRISGMDAEAVQQIFNRAIKDPPYLRPSLGQPFEDIFARSRAHDIRYFQWIIRERLEELRGVPVPMREHAPLPPRHQPRMPTVDEILRASDHYEALGLPMRSSPDRIKRRYRKQALLYHPDRHMEAPVEQVARFARAFQRITEAYDALMDPVKRRRYDAEILKRRPKTGRGWL